MDLTMDLTIEFEPIYYEPTLNEDGFYMDCLDLYKDYHTLENGVICTCGTKKEHVIMKNLTSFRQHIKSKSHQKWIIEKNCNLPNYYQECLNLKEQNNALHEHNQHLLYLLQQKDYQIQYLENMNSTYIHS